jgi:hypothetical protein
LSVEYKSFVFEGSLYIIFKIFFLWKYLCNAFKCCFLKEVRIPKCVCYANGNENKIKRRRTANKYLAIGSFFKVGSVHGDHFSHQRWLNGLAPCLLKLEINDGSFRCRFYVPIGHFLKQSSCLRDEFAPTQ